MVKKIVEEVSIPVLGSGDMFSANNICQFLKFTGASGVIIARGAIHNPEVFKQVKFVKEDLFHKIAVDKLPLDFKQIGYDIIDSEAKAKTDPDVVKKSKEAADDQTVK